MQNPDLRASSPEVWILSRVEVRLNDRGLDFASNVKGISQGEHRAKGKPLDGITEMRAFRYLDLWLAAVGESRMIRVRINLDVNGFQDWIGNLDCNSIDIYKIPGLESQAWFRGRIRSAAQSGFSL